MIRRVVGLVSASVLLSVGFSAPTSAADEVLVSNTGADFARTLQRPLFDPTLRWVPGDIRSATFHVRNNSDSPASFGLTVLGDGIGGMLASGALHLQVTSRGSSWSHDPTLLDGELMTDTKLAPGQSLPVRVRVAFDPQASNRTQLLSSELQLRVSLRQAGRHAGGPGTVPDAGPDRDPTRAGPSGLLPDTGMNAGFSWLLLLGPVLLGTGFALVTRRSHDNGDTHVE